MGLSETLTKLQGTKCGICGRDAFGKCGEGLTNTCGFKPCGRFLCDQHLKVMQGGTNQETAQPFNYVFCNQGKCVADQKRAG